MVSPREGAVLRLLHSFSEGTDSVHWGLFAVLKHEQQIRYSAHPYAKVYQTPWFIAYDIYHDLIVLSIRGSKTSKDISTDLKTGCSGESLPCIGSITLYYTDGNEEKSVLTHRVGSPFGVHSRALLRLLCRSSGKSMIWNCSRRCSVVHCRGLRLWTRFQSTSTLPQGIADCSHLDHPKHSSRDHRSFIGRRDCHCAVLLASLHYCEYLHRILPSRLFCGRAVFVGQSILDACPNTHQRNIVCVVVGNDVIPHLSLYTTENWIRVCHSM